MIEINCSFLTFISTWIQDFTLAGPTTDPGTLAAANAGLLALQAGTIGDCATGKILNRFEKWNSFTIIKPYCLYLRFIHFISILDTFSIRSGSGMNTPTICGTNVVNILYIITYFNAYLI